MAQSGRPMTDGEEEHRALCTRLSAPEYGQLPARRPQLSPPTDSVQLWFTNTNYICAEGWV